MIRECLRPDGVMLPSLFYIKIQKAKTRLVGGFFRIVVPGLGIENFFYHIDINAICLV